MTDSNEELTAINKYDGDLAPSLNCVDLNIQPPEGVIDLEVVGINGISNGRSCCQHDCCGASLSENELLRLVKCVVTINKKTEEAVKFVRVTADGDGCTIGFLPRVWLNHPKVAQNINNFCIVCELYDYSENKCKRLKSHRNAGMAGVILLSSIPIGE
jgi:hypothetical protein